MRKIGKTNLEQHSKSQFLCKLGEIMYRLTPTLKNVGNLHNIIKAGHILNLTKWIRYSTSSIFKNFLASVKVLLRYIWRWLAKCSSSSFYSACGDRGLKQIRKIFSNKCSCIFSTSPKWRKEDGLFLAGKDGTRWDYPKLHLVFLKDYKDFSFCEIWVIAPTPLFFFRNQCN